MSIYDEKKIITHEEAKINVSAINGWYSEELENELMDYIKQQEAKEERAKKEHELLELYKQQKKDREENSLSSTTLYWVIEKEIAIKEKELKEMN